MTQVQDSIKPYRIIVHGNNGFRSSQLLEQLDITPERCFLKTGKGRFEFFPFTDLNLFNKYLPIQPCPELARLIEQSQSVDISAILVLISQTEIFSQGMCDLISKIPYKDDKFGYRFGNEKEWWSRVIIVFSFGENEGGDDYVRESIAGNSGIREIVAKAGDRYISVVSNRTTPEEFIENLHKILTQQLKRKKLILGIDLSQKVQDSPANITSTELSLRGKLILLLTYFGFILLLIGVYYVQFTNWNLLSNRDGSASYSVAIYSMHPSMDPGDYDHDNPTEA